jgi:hypothetical protein
LKASRLSRKEAYNEGKADVSAQHSQSPARAWVSRENEFEERPFGAEATASEGTQASHRQQRIALQRENADNGMRQAALAGSQE